MHTFAHIADVHLGANRDPLMAECEINAFSSALDLCIERKVDFVLICGDLFHLGVPTDLDIVNKAVIKMREIKQHGIPIYAIYGSHDYTPTGTSIMDVVESAGLLVNVMRPKSIDGKLRLNYVEDERTGAKLVGISGRKMSMDRKYYEMLDSEDLERLSGFKIFAFHIGLDEFKPEYLRQMDTVSISSFPKGFDYYAGGHIHERSENSWPGYEGVVFPGALFAGYGRDLESIAKGEKRGFYIVSFGDEITDLEFVETALPASLYYEEDVSGLSSYEAQRKLEGSLSHLDVNGKLVVLKLKGTLSTGKTSDMNFTALRQILLDNGALQIHLNRYALQSKEYIGVMVGCEDTDAIEERLFREGIESVRVDVPDLRGNAGLKMSFELLKALRQEQKASEGKNDYAARVRENALEVLSLKRLFET